MKLELTPEAGIARHHNLPAYLLKDRLEAFADGYHAGSKAFSEQAAPELLDDIDMTLTPDVQRYRAGYNQALFDHAMHNADDN